MHAKLRLVGGLILSAFLAGCAHAPGKTPTPGPGSGPIQTRAASSPNWPTISNLPVFDVRTYGARAGDDLDDSTAIQAAETAARVNGGTVLLPPGLYDYTGPSLSVGSNVTIQGTGPGTTFLRVQAGRTTAAIEVTSRTNVALKGFCIIKAAGIAPGGRGDGILIRGNSADITVEDVTTDGMASGIYTGDADLTAGTVRRVVLNRVTCNNSPHSWGFNIDDTDTLTATDCKARGNWFDGFKLRKKTLNVTIRGGAFTGNGTSYVADPNTGAGDGIDVYAGGDTFTIDGADCSANWGNGVTAKTGPLNMSGSPAGSNAAAFGRVRNGRIINVTCNGNLFGSGLYLTLSNPGDVTEPVPANMEVSGEFNSNSEYGIYCSARNVVMKSPVVRKNQKHGIVLSSRGFDITINDPLCVANGQATANTWSGIDVAASFVVINGGRFIGVDGDEVVSDTALSGISPIVTRYGIQLEPGSASIRVNWPVGRYLVSHTVNDAAGATGGDVIINQVRAGNPNTNGAYGLAGSIYIRSSQGGGVAGNQALFVKTDGNRASPTTGWTPLTPFGPLAALPTADATTRGYSVRLVGGAGVSDGYYVCIKNAADTYAWQRVDAVQSIDGLTGAVVLSGVYAPLVHNHSLAGGTLTGFGTAAAVDTGITSGTIPVLGTGGKLDVARLPSFSITDVFTIASQAAMLALTADPGDVAIRTDQSNKPYMLTAADATILANWLDISGAASVASWNGLTGAITATTDNLGEGSTNLYFSNARALAAAPAVTLAASATPILGLSTQDLSFDTQLANTFLAGASSGGAAAPTFRLITTNDIPNLAESQITGLVADLGTHTTDIAARVPLTRNINTTAPLAGGGTLASDLTLTMAASSASVPGSMSAAHFSKLTRIGTVVSAGTITTNYTPDVSTGDTFDVTLGAATVTINAPTNPVNGYKVLYRLKQDGSGTRAVAWNAVFSFGSDITATSLTTTAGKIDYVGTVYDSTAVKWHVTSFVKGY